MDKTLLLSSCLAKLPICLVLYKNSIVCNQNKTGSHFIFCPEVNNARISGAVQPIKLCEKHYPPPEYMLRNIIYEIKRFSDQPTLMNPETSGA